MHIFKKNFKPSPDSDLRYTMAMLYNFLEQGNARIDSIISKIRRESSLLSEQASRLTPFGDENNTSTTSWKMEDFSPTREYMNVSPPGEDADLTLASVDENDRVQLLKVILEEYRQLPLHLPSGMVVVPSFDTLLEWHGSIHIKSGYFKGGIFKFVVHIPVDYPESPPSVYFFTPVFHPLVHPESGLLDISPAFPTWRHGRDYIVLVLSYLKKVFYKKDLNTYATSMSKSIFSAKCEECVAESLRLIYVSHPDSPIQFSPWTRGLTMVSLIDASEHKNNSVHEQIQAKVDELAHSDMPIQEQAIALAETVVDDIVAAGFIDTPVEDGVVISH